MLWLILIISTVCGLSNNIQELPSLYVLADDEFYTISLDEYFFGNNLKYEVFPKSKTILSESYSNFSIANWGGDEMEQPIGISLIQAVFENVGTNQILLYTSRRDIKLLYVNLELFFVYELNFTSFACVYMTQFYLNGIIPGLIILADNPSTNIYYTQVFEISNFDNVSLIINLENITNSYLGQGKIEDSLLVTGYSDDGFPVATFYDVSNISDATIIKTVYLGNESTKKVPIFAVTVVNQHYIIQANASKLLNFEIDDFGELALVNILELPYFKHVTDFQVNLNTEFLMIGFFGGFVMCSYDFEQVYIENDNQIFQEVFLTSTKFNNYALTRKDSNYNLYKLGQNFNLIGNVTLGTFDYNINWGVFSYYEQNSVFISNNLKLELQLYNITFSYPKLTFTSSPNETNYTLVVSQPGDKLSLNYNFTVRKPFNDTLGIIEPYPSIPIKVLFSNLSSQFFVPVQSYVIGSDLSIFSCNVSIPNYQYFFNYSLKIIPSIRSKNGFSIGQNEYEHIVISEKDFILFYNSSTISVYNSSVLLYSIHIQNATIKTVISCGNLNVFYYENVTSHILGYFRNNHTNNHQSTSLKYASLGIACSKKFIICLCTEGVYIYEIVYAIIINVTFIDNSQFTSNISSVSILGQTFMCVLLEDSQIMIIDLGSLTIFRNETSGPSKTLLFPGAKILSSFNLFISDFFNSVYMFDYSLTYIKKFKVLEGGRLSLYNQYLVSYTNQQIQVIDTNQWVTNSSIVNLSLTNWESFSVHSDSKNSLILYFLKRSQVEIYEIPQGYNQVEVNFTINDNFYNISSIEYNSNLKCLIKNQINSYGLKVEMQLFVNGETIYKDDKAIGLIQEENMKYQCGEVFNLPLSQIFSGQDLSASITKAKYVSLEQRFTQMPGLDHSVACDAYCYSYNKQLYIGVKECTVIVFNSNLTEKASQTIEDSYEYTCKCYSISVILDYSDTYFVIACTISKNLYSGMLDDEILGYFLYFGSYKEQIKIFDPVKLSFPSNKIKTYSLNGGLFIILSAENYDSVSNQEFYSNHLTLTYGEIVNNSIVLYNHSCDFSKLFKLNYYYLTDFDAVFDPLFTKFYIYSLDIYFGIRIFEFSGTTCSSVNTLIFNKYNPAYTLSICGFHLFVGMRNTDIHIYNMLNFFSPNYSSSILAYTDIYTSVQGSLRCSSEFNPNYLVLQMNNSNNFALHIIDLFSGNTSNILKDFIFNNSYEDPPKLVEFINRNGDLVVIINSTKSVYKLSSFDLLIDTTADCDEAIKESFNITVSNTKSKPVSANFNISIKKSYEPSKIQSSSIPLWLLFVICIASFSTALFMYYLIKKCSRKSKINTSLFLFNYQHEFNSLTKEVQKLE